MNLYQQIMIDGIAFNDFTIFYFTVGIGRTDRCPVVSDEVTLVQICFFAIIF